MIDIFSCLILSANCSHKPLRSMERSLECVCAREYTHNQNWFIDIYFTHHIIIQYYLLYFDVKIVPPLARGNSFNWFLIHFTCPYHSVGILLVNIFNIFIIILRTSLCFMYSKKLYNCSNWCFWGVELLQRPTLPSSSTPSWSQGILFKNYFFFWLHFLLILFVLCL